MHKYLQGSPNLIIYSIIYSMSTDKNMILFIVFRTLRIKSNQIIFREDWLLNPPPISPGTGIVIGPLAAVPTSRIWSASAKAAIDRDELWLLCPGYNANGRFPLELDDEEYELFRT